MIAFAKRNLKLYLRDRASVVFSLLAVFIVIGLYVLFLGDVWTNGLKEFERAKEIMDNWVMAGVLAITSMTTTLGMLGTMVKDRADRIEKDFFVAPVKRWQIAGGYMLSAYIVGVVMSMIALVAAEIYIAVNDGELMSLHNIARTLAVILLNTFMNTSIALFLVSLFQSINAYTTVNIVLGTLIGFLTGIYLPIGSYPQGVQWIIKLFPVSHGALIFRNIMMEPVMEEVFDSVPASVSVKLKEELGMIYMFGDTEFSLSASMGILIAVAVVFFGLACYNVSRSR